jgi:hypothetical protein
LANRSIVFVILIMLSGLMLAACATTSTTDDTDDAAEETPIATEPATPAPEPTEVQDTDTEEAPTPDQASDDADDALDPDEGTDDVDPVSLTPTAMFLEAPEGSQEGRVGPHFWVHEATGLAGEASGGSYELQDEPIRISSGEEVRFESEDDDFPHTLGVTIYPGEEDPEERVLPIDMDPIDEQELDADDAVWTVELDEGAYYVELATVWDTPEMFNREKESIYRFWIVVE